MSNDDTFILDNHDYESRGDGSELEEQHDDALQPAEKSSKNKNKEPSYRWGRKIPADVDTVLTGANFKQFFDNELFDPIVEQSNL